MLQAIDWRITSLCNEKCLYCYGSKQINRINASEERIILNKIITSPIRMVNITGGEPMLEYKRCFRIIRALSQGGKKIYLSTNGNSLLEYLDFVYENVALLGLPLDGYDEESNQINGRSVTSFSVVKNILEANALREQKINIKIGTVITRRNLSFEYLFKMCAFLQAYDIKIWRIYEMIPVNRGMDNKKILELNEVDRKKLHHIVQTIQKYNSKIKIELACRSERDSAYFIIQPDGTVIIPEDNCENAHERVIGDLLEESFSEVYNKWEKNACKKYDLKYMEQRVNDVS